MYQAHCLCRLGSVLFSQRHSSLNIIIATYHPQLLKLHESLLHPRLVDFDLFILLLKSKIVVALSLGGSRGDILQRTGFVLTPC